MMRGGAGPDRVLMCASRHRDRLGQLAVGGQPTMQMASTRRMLATSCSGASRTLISRSPKRSEPSIDWAETHHDVAIIDDGGQLVAKKRIPDDPAGFAQLVDATLCARRLR
jgi:Transposase